MTAGRGGGAKDPAAAQIVRLDVADAPAAGEVLSRSHAEYPAFRHVFPDPDRRRDALRAFMTAVARDGARFESVYAARTLDGRVQGVAVWLPPGAFPWSAARQIRAAPAMLSVLRVAAGSFLTFARTGANTARLHPSYPHWYLEVMGVIPMAQGVGIGGRLLEPVLAIADRDRIDCYLETSDGDNVGFYERHGFAVTDPALELVPGGPTHWGMRRRRSDPTD